MWDLLARVLVVLAASFAQPTTASPSQLWLAHAAPLPGGVDLVTLPLPVDASAPPLAQRDSDCDGLSDEEEDRIEHGPEGSRTDKRWHDSDFDGVADGTEMGRTRSTDPRCRGIRLDADPSTTTSPMNADSDGDGLADGVEDANRDGRRDAGESSPRRKDTDRDMASDAMERAAGTHPDRNAFTTVPEPMIYDLVRGLDAEAGELEANALIRIAPDRRGAHIAYAPEVEYAFLDGFAAELELPFSDERLEALKGALQATLVRAPDGRWGHGVQLLSEAYLHEPVFLTALTHIGQVRVGERVTIGSIAGGELVVDHATGEVHGAGLANLTLGYAVAPLVVTALETNVAVDDRAQLGWRLTPQMHVQVNHHFRMQMGLGAEGENDRVRPILASRMVLEL
jgi:hypothetical protein